MTHTGQAVRLGTTLRSSFDQKAVNKESSTPSYKDQAGLPSRSRQRKAVKAGLELRKKADLQRRRIRIRAAQVIALPPVADQELVANR